MSSEELDILEELDATYSQLPDDLLMEVEELASNMSEFGARQLRKNGIGADKYDIRPYRQGDTLRDVNWKITARRDGEYWVDEKREENRQPIFFWRKGSGTVNMPPEKKRHMDIALLTAAKIAVSAEDKIGILDTDGMYRGKSGVEEMASHFFDVNIISGNTPSIERELPHNSTIIIASDFMLRSGEHKEADKQEIIAAIENLGNMGLNGKVCMVLHPDEVTFPFKGAKRFRGQKGELPIRFDDAASIAEEYNRRMSAHIDWVHELVVENGFEFILHTTDKPPVELVLNMFGVQMDEPEYDHDYKL